MINVTKTYLPSKSTFFSYINRLFETGWLTNNGALVRELEQRLKEFLGVKHLVLVANGTLALQVAYKALGLEGEVITSPFSFPATASSLAWDGLMPIFADIDPGTFNLSPKNIEPLITQRTTAIVPVHVFGNPCEVETIEKIAHKHKLKVIYDAAHAFGIQYKGDSVLNHGDISTLSFHATKLFHTIEGGAIITCDDEIADRVRMLINFGIIGPEQICDIGINAKMNEFEAAMGLCVLDEIDNIISSRKQVWQRYYDALQDIVHFQELNSGGSQNYGYCPVVFGSESRLLEVQKKLNSMNIYPRRYFFPSLDTLDYFSVNQHCAISRDIASRILCLPLYSSLQPESTQYIIELVRSLV
jgi:dTDP-4-amino-4,6-dideoxygalactose transaminase